MPTPCAVAMTALARVGQVDREGFVGFVERIAENGTETVWLTTPGANVNVPDAAV